MKSAISILALAGALCAGHGVCHAQDGGRKLRWNADNQSEGTVAHKSRMKMNASVNGENYEIDINDDQVRAKVNGEVVPEDRIRVADDRIEILDEHGEVLHRFNVRGQGPSSFFPLDSNAQPGGQSVPRPKVMIGITMDDSPEGVRVDSVIDGLPAQAAGLKAGDIIRELNDKPVENKEDFRAAIGALEPGDQAELIVFRDGKDVELKVKLERFDDARLGGEFREQVFQRRIESPGERAHDEFMGELRKSFEGLGLSDDQRQELEKRLDSAFSKLSESMNFGLMFSTPQGRVWTIDPSTPDRGMTFKVPKSVVPDDQDRRIDQMMRRFDALERKIELLSRQLDETRNEQKH